MKAIKRREIEVGEPAIDNKLELAQFLAKVQSQIKDEITTDFVYAKLDEKDKKAIIEMVSNAYYSKKIIDEIGVKSFRWVWHNKEKEWERLCLTKEDKEKIEIFGKRVFTAYMTRMFMVAILNRNKKDNYLVQYSVGVQEEERNEEEDERIGTMKKIRSIMKNEEKAK